MNDISATLSEGLIVSCQIDESEPLHTPEHVALFAKAAALGGAVAVRTEGVDNTAAVLREVNLPVIACVRGRFDSGWILVTPDLPQVEDLLDVGAQCIALDGTLRHRPNGMLGHEFIAFVKEACSVHIVADIATVEEAIAAEQAGATAVSTVLFGRTEYSQPPENLAQYYDFIADLRENISIPILAEGFVWSPEEGAFAKQVGAGSVVVGGAITRPRLLTQLFAESLALPK